VAGTLALRRALRAIRPDVIHAHTARALFPLALAMPGVPVVLTHHNSRLSFPPSAFTLFNRIVDSYVAISDQCETLLRSHARKPVRMILNAASPRFHAGQPRVAAGRDPIILAVGTISAQKDYPTLLAPPARWWVHWRRRAAQRVSASRVPGRNWKGFRPRRRESRSNCWARAATSIC